MLDAIVSADLALRAWLVTHHTPWLDQVMWTLSAVGVAGSIWLAIAAVMATWSPRLRPAAWQVVLAIVLAQLVVDEGLKPLFARERPFVSDRSVRVVGYRSTTPSFPSGHSASSFAGAAVLAFALRRRWALITWTLAAAIALSRIYVGVHYPLDVLAGALVGVALGILVTGGRAWYIRRSTATPHLVPR